ncbi:MAG: hypothetical protein IIW26_03705, partial [Tidjanibacter sp.]|nr:hypothetical protein [Tidjanibacter sp.]
MVSAYRRPSTVNRRPTADELKIENGKWKIMVRRWRRVFDFQHLPKFSNAKSDDFRSVRDTN